MAKQIKRTLQLKVVKFNSRGKKDYTPPHVQDVLEKISSAAPTVGDRVYQHKVLSEDVTTVCFMNNFSKARNGVCAFEFCSYVPGQVPPQLQPDMKAKNAEHKFNPIVSAENSEPTELVHVAEVVMYGGVVIVESAKGAGGVKLLSKYITEMAKKHIDSKHYSIAFLDMLNRDLKDLIKKSGGVTELSLALAHEYDDQTSRFSKPLDPTRKMFANTGVVRVQWESKSNDVLGESEVISAYNDAVDEEGPEKIFIRFADGNTLNGFERFKIRKPVEVDDIGGRNPNRSQMRSALKEYLMELMTPDADGTRVIDTTGYFVKG